MARRPGVKSSVERLPKELQDLVNELIRDGYTIREMVDKLQELGANISKSSMGRYAKHAHETLQKYKEAQEVSKVWVDRLEKEPNGDVSALLKEMLKTVAFSTMASMSDNESGAKPGEIMALSIALKNLSSTEKEAFNIALLRKKIQEQAQQVAEMVCKEAIEAGVSEEQVNNFRFKIIGVAKG